MPRKLHQALTPFAVKSLGPGRHADGAGLYLRVQDKGARSWLFRSIIGGKARDIGLGPAAGAGAISLAEARTKAKELAAQASKGEPLEGKRSKAQKEVAKSNAEALTRRTFREVAEALVDLKEGEWKNAKHRQQWRNTLATYAYPIIGDKAVSAIGTDDILAVLKPIWNDKPETASRLRGRIENVLSAAKVQGMRTGDNPALWRGHLDHLLPKPGKLRRGHHPALAYAELPAFMAILREREAVAARALEFAILTATRTGEVIGATWGEVDLDKAEWTIPSDRMKAGREHTVPLSPRAISILEGVSLLNAKRKTSAPIFPRPDGSALSGMAMAMLIRRMHEAEQAAGRSGWVDRKAGGRIITGHGFRSTFRDWAGEQSSFPREVIEHAMAHRLPDKAEASYARATLLPKRVKLMKAWADYCDRNISVGVNVTPIGKVKAN